MTDQQPVLRARQVGTGMVPTREAHDVEMARATAIARATQMVPKAYQQNPGAVLLAQVWADAHDIDLVTTMQSVTFIHGKPFVSAEMQAAMAKRAGYRLKTEQVSDDAATVSLYEGGELLGRETVTMADAQRAGWATGDTWRKFPRNMLLARARTNVIRFYAPDVLLGLHSDDERDDVAADPVDTLSAPVAEVVPLHADQADQEVVDAEVVAPDPERPTVADVDGPITAATKGKATAAYDLASTSENGPAVKMAMQAEGIPLAKSRWTECQGLRVIELCDTTPGPDGAA